MWLFKKEKEKKTLALILLSANDILITVINIILILLSGCDKKKFIFMIFLLNFIIN